MVGDVDTILRIKSLIIGRTQTSDAQCIDDIILLIREWEEDDEWDNEGFNYAAEEEEAYRYADEEDCS